MSHGEVGIKWYRLDNPKWLHKIVERVSDERGYVTHGQTYSALWTGVNK